MPDCAATSAAKSVSSFSIPSPREKRTKPLSSIGCPTRPDASFSICPTDFDGSYTKA